MSLDTLVRLLPRLDDHDEATADSVDRLRRAIAGLDEGPAVVALVGPSGTGRSRLLNALAGAEITPTGPLRPTTSEPVAWGNPGGRLPGAVVAADPTPLDGVVVVDVPSGEHHPDLVDRALLGSDVALVVVDAHRYADRVVAELIDRIDAAGLPRIVLALGVPPEVVEHLAELWGPPVVEPAPDRPEATRRLLERVHTRAEDVRARRRHTLAAAVVAEVDRLAARLDEAHGATERARREIADTVAAVDRPRIAGVYAWEIGVGLAARVLDAAAAETAERLGVVPPPSTAPALDHWVVEVDRLVGEASRRRWRRRRLLDDVVALALDPDHRPRRVTRRRLRSRLDEVAAAAAAAFDDVVADLRGSLVAAAPVPEPAIRSDELVEAVVGLVEDHPAVPPPDLTEGR